MMPTLPPRTLPLTRAVNLCDFEGICHSAAAWQQAHAADAYARWRSNGAPRVRKTDRVVVLNWGAATFRAPETIMPVDYYDGAADHTIVWPDSSLAAIYLLSVIDRVDQPMIWLRHAGQALVPGGLIVATFALWDATGIDCAIGHELRKRIYDRASWRKLIYDVRGLGLQTFGGVDLRYPGDTLGDHTLAALTLTKGRLV